MRTLDAINVGILDKAEGISITNNPIIDALKKEAKEEAKRLTKELFTKLFSGDDKKESKDIEPKEPNIAIIAPVYTPSYSPVVSPDACAINPTMVSCVATCPQNV